MWYILSHQEAQYILTMEYYSPEKDVNPVICNTMDESGGHYAKWSKPDREKQTAQPHSNVKS